MIDLKKQLTSLKFAQFLCLFNFIPPRLIKFLIFQNAL